ncbi:GNAT family N-acetyltransferase [Pseudoxanthobacter sp.]|uniref:GNAT family N-acetyltransferase n=1 Tax=Pseudoxanthobacter sp. TaxID=1925742 RepID=UPI002FE31C68
MTPIVPVDLPAAEWHRDGYCLSTDRARIDVDTAHRFLSGESYWAQNRSRAALERAIAGSLPVGLYAPDGTMAGFARVVTDYSVFAYLLDVFVLPAHRGHGLASWLAAAIRTHPDLLSVRTWMLATRDAHAVYEKAGYRAAPHPDYFMRVPEAGD